VLIAELDHRVKNVLARVAVVAMYTRQGSNSMDEFVQALDGRIQSMATAHALLSQNRWQGVALTDLVHRQLAPYTTNFNTTIGGPDIALTAAATQAVAMVLQELVTNTVKYGALSTQDGRVSVTWDRRPGKNGAARLFVTWREIGGPSVVARRDPGMAPASYAISFLTSSVERSTSCSHPAGCAVVLIFRSSGGESHHSHGGALTARL